MELAEKQVLGSSSTTPGEGLWPFADDFCNKIGQTRTWNKAGPTLPLGVFTLATL
jgi:hypothetical protein